MSELFTLTKEEKKPHHTGHRDRLRQRFLQAGAEALADYELLELILFIAIPRKDVKPLAKELIAIFKTFNGVFHASREELLHVTGVSETTATAIQSVKAAAFRLLKQDIIDTPILSNWTQLTSYCQTVMAAEKIEQFRVFFLNRKNRLIADEIQSRGTVDQSAVYTREIVKRALDLGATAMILAHNHPSGDPRPSQADIEMTKEIIRAAEPMGITIHDHVIIAKSGVESLRNSGLI
ncbi:MAG: hypothetical protein CMH30_07240 [Micavibrio sp.]|nr:hypothetical protein [Micavibrio sp.]|tara:strand:- start:86 stop:793 length:708 start_codon:yes stop_codon:yes gene_type:complete